MWRTLVESSNGSYAGRMAPPGIPKTVSTSDGLEGEERAGLCARGPWAIWAGDGVCAGAVAVGWRGTAEERA
jgi:hypothetical protein